MTPEYAAGFFDGEGCVNITVRGKSRQVSLRVTVVNTDQTILDDFAATWPGSFISYREHKKNPHWKPFRAVTWHSGAAVDFLRALHPFLRLKKRQAELAFLFWDFMHTPKKERCEIIQLPDASGFPGTRIGFKRRAETLRRELEFKEQMHLLNKKGA